MTSDKRIFQTCSRRLGATVAACALLFFIFGCAKIADPQPPEIRVPKAAEDLYGKQIGASVVLEVSPPRQNTSGSPVTTLQRVELYRLAEDPGEGRKPEQIPAEEFEKDAGLLYSIPENRLSDFRIGDSLVLKDSFTDTDPSYVYTHAFRYALLFVNNKNQAAGFSNQILIAPVAIPLPPDDIQAEVHEDFIRLNWAVPLENLDGTRPPRISGYNVYRDEVPDKPSSDPLNAEPLREPEFRDVHFQFEKTYYYRVSILGSLQEPIVESARSEYAVVVPKDIFPPLPAVNLNAVQDGNAVVLLWQPSPSGDVEGYRIYRTQKSEQRAELLQTEGTIRYSFRDTATISGVPYVYTVEAIDRYGNKSDGVTAEITLR